MWMIGEFFVVVGCVSDVFFVCIHILFHRAQPALIFTQNHHTTHTKKTEDCMHLVNYGWKGRISWERQSGP